MNSEYQRRCKFCGINILIKRTSAGWRAFNLDGTFHAQTCTKDANGQPQIESLTRLERESQEDLWRRYEAAA